MIQPKNRKFLELARKLAPNDKSLGEEVREVLEDFVQEDVRTAAGFEPSQGYFVVEIESESAETVAWNTLIEGLIDREKLVEIDKRESPEGVAKDIDLLLIGEPVDPNRWVWANFKELWREFPNIFLKKVQQHVIGPNKTLAILTGEYSSESYLVCLINESDYPKIVKLIQEISYGSIEKVVDMKNPEGIH